MNKSIAIVAFLFFLAAFIATAPILAETSVAKSKNSVQADSQETTKRLIARWSYIKELALENLKKIAPDKVEQLDNSLEQVKQLLDKRLAVLSDAASIFESALPPKTPLISPLGN